GLADARGAVVTRVYPDSAAAAAGIQVGDVIVAANGQRIDDRDTLRNFEGLQAVGAKVVLDLRREGKPVQVAATLREQPRALPGARPGWTGCWSRTWPAAAAPPPTDCGAVTWSSHPIVDDSTTSPASASPSPTSRSNWSCGSCAAATAATC